MFAVVVDPSSQGKYAVLFDDEDKASAYIKERYESYLKHDPVKRTLDKEYAEVKWGDEDYLTWTLCPVLTEEAAKHEP